MWSYLNLWIKNGRDGVARNPEIHILSSITYFIDCHHYLSVICTLSLYQGKKNAFNRIVPVSCIANKDNFNK